MKRAQRFFEIVAGLVIIGALALGAVLAFRALSGGGAASALPETPQGYPPPGTTATAIFPTFSPEPPTPTFYPDGTPTPPFFPPPILTASPLSPEWTPPVSPMPTWATITPLPTLSADNPSPFAAQNIKFGPIVAWKAELLDPFGHVSWSPDGQTLAFSLYTGKWKANGGWPTTDIALVDAQGQNMQSLTRGYDPKWSPSGDLIAYFDYSDNMDELYIRIVDVNTRQVTLVTIVTRSDDYPILAWLSDTELLYFQGTIILFDYRTGQKSNLLEMVTPSWSVATSKPLKILATEPKQGLIAMASGEMLVILERSTAGFQVLKQLEAVDNSALAWSPDGNALAYVSAFGQQVTIVSTRGDEPVVALPWASHSTAWALAWSPDGTSLIYVDADGVHLVNRDGSGLRRLEGLPEGIPRLAWSPQGNLLVPVLSDASGEFFALFSLPVLIVK